MRADVAQRFLQSALVGHQPERDDPRQEDRAHQQIDQHSRSHECPQSSGQLPLSRAQAANDFPEVAEARVARTASPSHSQQDSAWKEAILENGLTVRVPLFIAPGETVRVEVKTGRYVERSRAERKRSA